MTAPELATLRVSELAPFIAEIRINRPEVLNALNERVLLDIYAAIRWLENQGNTRVAILTGEGKAFAAGADIAAMSTMSARESQRFSSTGHEVMQALEAATFPVIAAVNGFCLGGGMELALACDFIYASEKAKFGQPEAKLGLITGFGGSIRLTRRVGEARCKELIYSGDMIDAARAQAIGIALEVFAADTFADDVLARAKTIAERAPLAISAAKHVIREGADADTRVGCALEAQAFGVLFDTDDAKQGMKAFLEKRAHTFSGK